MRICPECLARYPSDQVRCANARHTGRLLTLDEPPAVIDASSDPSGSGSRIGTLVDGRYLLLGLLGGGAMGVVYRAHQRLAGREVAIKVVDLVNAAPHERVELGARFLREVKALARLESPFIARFIDSGALPDGSLYFAMERVGGESLDKVLLIEGRLSPDRVLLLARQLAEALAQVHAAGLVHRDVKPANLMVSRDADGRDLLKLVDFGIAGIARPKAGGPLDAPGTFGARLTAEGAILGSFPYMAPEQLTPRAAGATREVIGPWTDVYAAGCTLYELAVGRPPFPGPTAPAFVHQHLTEAPPSLLEHLDDTASVRHLDALIRAALAKDPMERPRDGAALGALLETALSRGSGSAPAADAPIEWSARGGPGGSPPAHGRASPGRSERDPAAIGGVSAELVRQRASLRAPPERASRLTRGRVALALALLLGLADLVVTLAR